MAHITRTDRESGKTYVTPTERESRTVCVAPAGFMRTHRLRANALAIATCALAAFLSSCTHSPSRPTPQTEDVAAILAFNQRYVKAINDGDFATLSSLTTEEHVMLPPNRAPVVGKAANDAANLRATGQFRIAETWSAVETEVAGDWAWQRGTFEVIASPKAGGEGRTMIGNYLHIYRRQPDGSWRMVRDMFNTVPAPEGN